MKIVKLCKKVSYIPDGQFIGKMSGYVVTFRVEQLPDETPWDGEYELYLDEGIRGFRECIVVVNNGDIKIL